MSECGTHMRRLNIRITDEDYLMLTELKWLLGQKSDSATIRSLIELHHQAMRSEVRKLRKVK